MMVYAGVLTAVRTPLYVKRLPPLPGVRPVLMHGAQARSVSWGAALFGWVSRQRWRCRCWYG